MATSAEMKLALKAEGIATKGLDEAALLIAYNRLQEDEDYDDEDEDDDDATPTSADTIDAFLAARQGAASGKITNRAGKGGINPMRFKEVSRLGEVVSCEATMTKAGKPTFKLQVRVIGASQGYCYSSRAFEIDDLVIVNCRILSAGVYIDADAAGTQRELVVEKGRKMAYQMNQPKFATKQRLEVLEAAKTAGMVEL